MVDSPLEPRPLAPSQPSLAYLAAFFAGGNIAALALRFIGGIFLVRVTTPELLGSFNSIGLVAGYLVFLQLGVMHGLNRELPYYFGKGDSAAAREYASAAQAWLLLIGVITGIGMLGVSVFHLVNHNLLLAAGWLVYSFNIFAMFFGTYYLQITFRTKGDFARLAMINVIANAASLLLIYFVSVFGYLGLCLRLLLTDLTNLAFLWKWRPLRVKPQWSPARLKELLKVGAPIFVTSQIYAWWSVFSSSLVLHYIGKSGLGLYQVVLITGSAFELLAFSLLQVLYPRLTEHYGRSGNARDLIQMIKRPTIYLLGGLCAATGASYFLLPFLIQWIAPNYQAAVPAAQWNLISVALMGFLPVTLIFNVIKRQDYYLVATVAGIAVFGLSCILLSRTHQTVEIFPQAMIAGRAVFFGLCMVFLAIYYRKEASQSRP